MHGAPAQPALRRLWLFSGTGEGPPLAERLLAMGWRLRVSVVTPAAAAAYPCGPCLELRVGTLDGADTLTRELLQAEAVGRPFQAVVDATHPFAWRIQQNLDEGCFAAGVPLLRLERAFLPVPTVAGPGPVRGLDDLTRLRAERLAGTRLLLAIGSRHLHQARRNSPGALHHARVLPTPAALRQALAAGIQPDRLAPLHPASELLREAGAVEAALVRRWRIEVILARASGPPTETLWRRVAAAEGCLLLLLLRPPGRQQLGRTVLSGDALLRRLAAWPG